LGAKAKALGAGLAGAEAKAPGLESEVREERRIRFRF